MFYSDQIEILRLTRLPDGGGAFTKTYETAEITFCFFEPLSGKDRIAKDKTPGVRTNIITHRASFNPDETVLATDRLRFQGQDYEIMTVMNYKKFLEVELSKI